MLAQGLLNGGRATLLLGCLEVCLEDSLDKAGESYLDMASVSLLMLLFCPLRLVVGLLILSQ